MFVIAEVKTGPGGVGVYQRRPACAQIFTLPAHLQAFIGLPTGKMARSPIPAKASKVEMERRREEPLELWSRRRRGTEGQE
jgi:hypothetical protein